MPEYLTPPQLATLLGLSVRTIEDHRRKGTGPRFMRIGKHVRYALSDVRIWLETKYANAN
jgi:excisionase family DNA binding protein